MDVKLKTCLKNSHQRKRRLVRRKYRKKENDEMIKQYIAYRKRQEHIKANLKRRGYGQIKLSDAKRLEKARQKGKKITCRV